MATGTWTSVATSGNWSATGNWSGGIVADGAGFNANFTSNITATTTVTLDSVRTIGNLVFSDNGAAGSSWTIAGANALTLNNSGSPSTLNAITNVTIQSPITNSAGITSTGAAVVFVSGSPANITGPVAITNGVFIFETPGATATIPAASWAISSGAVAVARPSTSGGVVTVNGNMTGAGRFACNGDFGFAVTTSLTGSVSGLFDINSYERMTLNCVDLPYGQAVISSYNGNSTALNVNYAVGTYPTPPAITTNLQFGSLDANSATYTFNSSGSQTFVSSGKVQRTTTGSQALSLSLGGSAGGTFNGAGTNAGSGVTNVTKSGASTYEFGGNNNTVFNGSFVINGGTVKATNSNALGTAASAITMSASTVLALAGDISFPRAVSAIGTIRNDSGSNSLTNTVTLIGNTIFDVTGSLALSSNPITGAFGISKNGAGSLTLNATASTFNGAVTLNSGTTIASVLAASGSNSAIGAGSSVIFTGTGILRYTGTAAVTFNRALTFTSATAAGFENNGTGTLILNGAVSATSSTIALAGSNTGFNRLDTAVTGANGFAKSGAGRWITTAANNLTGSSPITGGTLVAANAAWLSTRLVGSPVISGGAKLQIAKESDNKGRCTYGSLSMGLGATAGNKARLRIGGVSTSPTVLMNGNLVLPTSGTVTFDVSGDAFKVPGTYTLVEFASGGVTGGTIAANAVTYTGSAYRNAVLSQTGGASAPITVTITKVP